MSLEDDLSRPEAYEAKTTRVDLVRTHIASVFLLDRDVFKIKRPVDLGFLDFRTIESRLAACEAEVRLNARLAPRVYEGLEAVRRGVDGRCRIGGDGEIVDWAVHMRRMPDERRADVLLEHDMLAGAKLDALAERLAAFHAAARSDDETSSFGTCASILCNVEENFAQTRDEIDAFVRPEEADEIVRWQRAFIQGHRALFDERIATGKVRDGHGDLQHSAGQIT